MNKPMHHTKSSTNGLAQVAAVGDRLRGAVRGLVDSFPSSARTISGMARYLGLHKATCQRVVEGLEHVSDPVESFARLPGVRGLHTIVEAAVKKGTHQAQTRALLDAIHAYEQLLKTHGRTQAGLVKLIDSLREDAVEGSAVAVRRGSRDRARDRRKALFDAAWLVTGEEVRTKSVVAVLYPDPRKPKMLRLAIASTLTGVIRHPFSRPIAPFILSAGWAKVTGAGAGEERPQGVDPDVPSYEILEGFSTAGLNPLTLQAEDGLSALVVDLGARKDVAGVIGGSGVAVGKLAGRDPRDPTAMGPVDVSVLFRTTSKANPAFDPSAITDFAVRISQPCRDVVMDMFVHRSIPVRARGTASAYSLVAPPGDTPAGHPDRCEHERFPDSAAVVSMDGESTRGVRSPYERQGELIEHIFKAEGLDRAEFHWDRMQTVYPLWQTEYRVLYERV